MNKVEKSREKMNLSGRDKVWVVLAIVMFLVLFAIVILYGDGIMGTLF